jgi:hypothetical protein
MTKRYGFILNGELDDESENLSDEDIRLKITHRLTWKDHSSNGLDLRIKQFEIWERPSPSSK